jgi:hypothetical protein
MDALLEVPNWAVDYCPVYLIVAAVAVISNLTVLASFLFKGPLTMKKSAIAVALLFNSVIIGFMSFLQFWVCKSALSKNELQEGFRSRRPFNRERVRKDNK